MRLSESWNRHKNQWDVLTYYQRFEGAVAFVLTVMISGYLLGLAAITLALALTYRLMRGPNDPS
jgi:hypothetical protein